MADPGMAAVRAGPSAELLGGGRGGRWRHLWLLAGGGLVRHELVDVGVGLRGAHDLLALFGVRRLDRRVSSLC